MWMIGQEQGQRDLRVTLFRLPDRTGSQTVKAAVVSHHKFSDTVLSDMALYLLGQHWQHPFSALPVSDEKAG